MASTFHRRGQPLEFAKAALAGRAAMWYMIRQFILASTIRNS
jgi:hypothetical protein